MTSIASSAQATRLPEWFIGGPWHGRDRVTDYPGPDINGVIRVRWAAPADAASYATTPQPTMPVPSEPKECRYERRQVILIYTLVVVWVEASWPSLSERDICRALMEILLAPHRVPVERSQA